MATAPMEIVRHIVEQYGGIIQNSENTTLSCQCEQRHAFTVTVNELYKSAKWCPQCTERYYQIVPAENKAGGKGRDPIQRFVCVFARALLADELVDPPESCVYKYAHRNTATGAVTNFNIFTGEASGRITDKHQCINIAIYNMKKSVGELKQTVAKSLAAYSQLFPVPETNLVKYISQQTNQTAIDIDNQLVAIAWGAHRFKVVASGLPSVGTIKITPKSRSDSPTPSAPPVRSESAAGITSARHTSQARNNPASDMQSRLSSLMSKLATADAPTNPVEDAEFTANMAAVNSGGGYIGHKSKLDTLISTAANACRSMSIDEIKSLIVDAQHYLTALNTGIKLGSTPPPPAETKTPRQRNITVQDELGLSFDDIMQATKSQNEVDMEEIDDACAAVDAKKAAEAAKVAANSAHANTLQPVADSAHHIHPLAIMPSWDSSSIASNDITDQASVASIELPHLQPSATTPVMAPVTAPEITPVAPPIVTPAVVSEVTPVAFVTEPVTVSEVTPIVAPAAVPESTLVTSPVEAPVEESGVAPLVLPATNASEQVETPNLVVAPPTPKNMTFDEDLLASLGI